MIDTHAHIYLPQFEADLDQVIERAREQGINSIFMPNIDAETIGAMHRVEQKYPGFCHSMMGLHPCSVNSDPSKALSIMYDHLLERPYTAVGEIGIDLHWDDTYKEQQIEAFHTQCLWAVELDLPIVIHSRKSLDLIISLLQDWAFPDLTGIFHCFGGTQAQAHQILDLGFVMGIGGVVTFKNTTLRDVLASLSLDHVVLETDAPYLAPTPHRGKRNEPSYVSLVAQEISQCMDMPIGQVIASTTQNALQIFHKNLTN